MVNQNELSTDIIEAISIYFANDSTVLNPCKDIASFKLLIILLTTIGWHLNIYIRVVNANVKSLQIVQ